MNFGKDHCGGEQTDCQRWVIPLPSNYLLFVC